VGRPQGVSSATASATSAFSAACSCSRFWSPPSTPRRARAELLARPHLARGQRGGVPHGVSNVGPLSFKGLEEMARDVPVAKAPRTVALEDEIAFGPLAGWKFGSVLTAVLLLFMLGAAGKSAQLPLYVWLPDAMAGPTRCRR